MERLTYKTQLPSTCRIPVCGGDNCEDDQGIATLAVFILVLSKHIHIIHVMLYSKYCDV